MHKNMIVGDKIIISKDFTKHPGARYISDGEWSGELFLKDHLLPKYEKAVKEGYKVLIDLDKVYGYPSSFVSGSFGKLSIDKGADQVLKYLQFKSEENPIRLKKIINEIEHPTKDKRAE